MTTTRNLRISKNRLYSKEKSPTSSTSSSGYSSKLLKLFARVGYKSDKSSNITDSPSNFLYRTSGNGTQIIMELYIARPQIAPVDIIASYTSTLTDNMTHASIIVRNSLCAISVAKSSLLTNQIVHIVVFKRIIIEPDHVGFLRLFKHSVDWIEYFLQQQKEEFFLDATSVFCLFAKEFYLENNFVLIEPTRKHSRKSRNQIYVLYFRK